MTEPRQPGDRHPPLRPLTADEQALVLQWQNYAYKLASKAARFMLSIKGYHNTKSSTFYQYFNDLFQAANLGLIIAAQRYDQTKSKFSTYATPWIRQQIQIAQWRQLDIRFDSIKNSPVKKRRVGLFTEIGNDIREQRGEHSYTFDVWNEEDEPVYYDDKPTATNEILCLLHLALNPRQEYIVTRCILEDATLQTVADELDGITRERVRQLLGKALERLRKNKAFMNALDKQWKRRQLSTTDFFGMNIATKIA